ncbi:MAG: hypothetical protein IME99_10215 [Proteobacteria bacterium]|nr:hypothetical protein [Pseudomonadota bacterium]
MDIDKLTAFFKWCTIIDGVMLALSTALFMAAPDFVYHTQTLLFDLDQSTFNAIYYSFLGLFKIVFIAFNLVPYVALRIIK